MLSTKLTEGIDGIASERVEGSGEKALAKIRGDHN